MTKQHSMSETHQLQTLLLSSRTGDASNSNVGAKVWRVQVHFSEAVCDFIADDLEVENCSVLNVALVRNDFYIINLTLSELSNANTRVSVRLPAEVVHSASSREVSNLASDQVVYGASHSSI